MNVKRIGFFILALNVVAAAASAQNVKITPLGSHTGEFCATDRALIFEDPTGVRILYDAGQSVAGGTDPRLGMVHVVLLSHAHGDHIGDVKLVKVDGGSCARPETVSAAPHSNTAEIAAAKNSAVVASNDMSVFLGRKIENIRGIPTGDCTTTALTRETTVPQSVPCRANLQLGGKRTLKFAGAREGVGISLVQADHSNNVPRSLLTDGTKTNLAADALTAYVGHANGYVLEFTNGLKVYLTGDTALMGDMKTIISGFYQANLVVINTGAFAMQSHQAAYAVNELIQPNAVIPSHANEAATAGGKLRAESRTRQFVDLIKGRPVHLPLSGKIMEFDGSARCVAGCSPL
ncbi:MAG TPA: MBL fold metallo-hydrolase [Gemmatimonadaceae bacterium]|nr:MBL fold metallo-hydrolase [Gemmatimonadaceae bacterium]